MNKQEIGSMTAKGGFINETDICNKFVDYKNDNEAKTWLSIMGYNPNKIQKIFAIQIPVRINLEKAISLGVSQEKYDETIKFKKADIQVRVEMFMSRPVDRLSLFLGLSRCNLSKNSNFYVRYRQRFGQYRCHKVHIFL